MGWLDDLSTRAQQAAQERLGDIGSNITSYLEGQISGAAPTVKVGEPPAGNRTAAEIARGQAGAPTSMAAPAPAAGGMDTTKIALIAGAGLVALLLFMRRRRS